MSLSKRLCPVSMMERGEKEERLSLWSSASSANMPHAIIIVVIVILAIYCVHVCRDSTVCLCSDTRLQP